MFHSEHLIWMAYGSLWRCYLWIACAPGKAVSPVEFSVSVSVSGYMPSRVSSSQHRWDGVAGPSNQDQMCSAVQNQVSTCWVLVICNSAEEGTNREMRVMNNSHFLYSYSHVPNPRVFGNIPLALSMPSPCWQLINDDKSGGAVVQNRAERSRGQELNQQMRQMRSSCHRVPCQPQFLGHLTSDSGSNPSLRLISVWRCSEHEKRARHFGYFDVPHVAVTPPSPQQPAINIKIPVETSLKLKATA